MHCFLLSELCLLKATVPSSFGTEPVLARLQCQPPNCSCPWLTDYLRGWWWSQLSLGVFSLDVALSYYHVSIIITNQYFIFLTSRLNIKSQSNMSSRVDTPFHTCLLRKKVTQCHPFLLSQFIVIRLIMLVHRSQEKSWSTQQIMSILFSINT